MVGYRNINLIRALNPFHSNFYKISDGTWKADKVVDIPAKKVSKDGVVSEINGNSYFNFISFLFSALHQTIKCIELMVYWLF